MIKIKCKKPINIKHSSLVCAISKDHSQILWWKIMKKRTMDTTTPTTVPIKTIPVTLVWGK